MFIRQASEDNHWHLSAHYRSRAAAEKLRAANIRTKAQYQAFCRASANGIRHEHMVPGEAVYVMLLSLPDPSLRAFEDLLLRTSIRATITVDEDRRLSRDTMPAAYFDPQSPLYQNPLARYIAAGIADELEPRSEAGWFPLLQGR
jgi:hypothetical protein